MKKQYNSFRNTIKSFAILGVLSLLSGYSLSQISGAGQGESNPQNVLPPCGFDELHQHKMTNDPDYYQRTMSFENIAQGYSIPKTASTNNKVPVVVHVMSTGNSLTEISDDEIRAAIKALNERFRKAQGSLGDGNGVDVTIGFALAVRDPNGNCTNGIVRVDMTGNATYMASGVKNSTVGISDASLKATSVWDQTKYYNIWLVSEIDNNNGGAGIQGYALFASSHGNADDGAVILASNFKDKTSTTTTHELGHAFNLYHTFEGDGGGGTCPPNANCNTEGDRVCDIPPHRRSNSDCVVGTNPCDGGSSTNLFIHNYLDYSSDACQNMFTAGQRTRMIAALTAQRGSFLAANGNISLVPPSTATVDFTASSSVICQGAKVTFEDISLCSSNTFMDTTAWLNTTFAWTITNGTTTYNSSLQNPRITFTNPGTYNVTLQITNAHGTSSHTKQGMVVVSSAATNACTPGSTNAGNFGQTVSKVTFGAINNSTSTTTNIAYTDYTCTHNTVLAAGSTYPLNVTINAGGSGPEVLEVYIDYNNNGTFEATEKVLNGSVASNNSTTITGNITVPGTAVKNTLLRMRVIGETNTLTTDEVACGSDLFMGDVEDYGVYISDNVASVTISASPSSTITYGTNVTFTATPVNGGGSPTYTWYVNNNVIAGQTTNTYANNTLVQGDKVRCVMTSNLSGVIGSPVSSNEITMTVTGPPLSEFSANPRIVCAGNSVTFSDQSQLAPTSWSWSFPGGTPATSNSQNPVITYNTPGTYNATLTASNALGTGTTEVKTNYITVYSTPGAICGPFNRTAGTCCGIGITQVQLNTINKSTAYDDAVYQDFACTDLTTLNPNTSYNISVTVGTANSQWVRVYIDYNNDGDFNDTGELVFSPANGTGTRSGSFTTVASPVTGQILRMRVISDFVSTTPGACTASLENGQVEDYGVIFSCASPGITNQPSNTTICAGQNTSFSCTASGANPLSYQWQVSTNGGGAWSNLSNDATYSNTTTATMTISNASLGLSTYQYRCVVTNGCGSATTNAGVLTVNAVPTITGTTPGSRCGTGTVSLGATASAGTISWYSSATGGTALGTGTSFTTPTISTTTTYYVETTSGGCTSTPRQSVVATVNSAPTITGTTPGSRCGTGTVSLGATASAGTISWYSSATGGTALGTGTSFTTPTISTTTTYYVETTSGGCTSTPRQPVVATVNSAPTITGTTPGSRCGTGTVSLGATASAGTISWYSSATGGTALGTGTSFTTPTISTTTTYYVETTSGGCTSTPRQSVVATVNSALTITGTTPGSRCGTGTVSLGATASAGTISWYSTATGGTALGTGTSFTTPTISTTTTYYVETTNGGCTSTPRQPVVATVNSVPTITGTTPGSRCGTGTVSLGATASAGTISWYSSATGGTALGTGTSFTTPTISTTTTYYVETTSGGCTSTPRQPVVATVNSVPTITGTTPGSRCGTGTVSLGATASAGTISWYSSATGGTALGTGTSFTTPTISTTTTYYVETTSGGCTSTPRQSVVATVNSALTITGTTPGSRCGTGTVSLGATASAGTISWYSSATGGTALGTGTSFTTPTISTTTTYYVETTSGGCTSTPRQSVVATVNSVPSITTGTTTNPTTCSGTDGSIVVNGTGTGNVSWTGTASGNATGVNLPYTITGLGAGSYAITFTNGCPSNTLNVSLSDPSAPTITGTTPGSRCGTGTVSLGATASAGTIFWYSSATGGTALGTGTSFTTPTISTTTTYYVETIGVGCTSTPRQSVVAIVNSAPTITTGTTTNPTTCSGTDGSIVVNGTGTGTISWTGTASGNATGVNLPYTITSLGAGSYAITFTNGCPSNTLNISLSDPSAPTITGTTPGSRCGTGTVSLGATASAGTISWYSAATGGTALGTGTSFTTPTISTTTTYYVETTSGGCTSTPRQSVVATVNSVPSITTGTTTNPTTCSGTDGSIVVNGTGTGTVSWTGTASGNATGVNLPYTITGLGAGSYAITFTNGCPSNTLNVSLSDPSAPTITGTTPGSRCGTGTVSLGATASAGTISWYSSATGGTALGTGTSFTTPTISTTTTYYVETTSGGCTSTPRQSVVATVNNVPSITTGTTTNPTTCSGTDGSIVVNGTGTGNVSWTGTASGNATGVNLPYTITGLGAGSYAITFTNGCPSNTLNVSLSDPSAPTITGTTPGSRCGTGTVSLGATASAGTISWYSSATGGTALGTGTSFTTPTISTTTTYYVETTGGGCTSTPRQSVVATVNSVPSITTGTTTNPTTCSGTDGSIVVNGTGTGTISWTGTASGTATGVNLPYTITGLGAGSYAITFTNGCPSNTLNVSLSDPSAPTITGTTPGSRCGTGTVSLGATASAGTISWYSSATGGTALGTGTSFTTPTISTTTTYYVETTSGGCTSTPRQPVVATVNSAPTITGTTPGSRCGTGTVSLGATASAGTISWYSAATGGTALGTGTSFTTPTISTTTTYYVETTGVGCTSTPRQSVVATVNSAPTITTGTTTNPTTCSGTDGSIVVNGTGTGTVSWTGTASGNATGVNLPYTITGLGAGSYAITFTNGCPSNTLNISLSDPSAPTITGTTPGSRCGTGTVSLGATASAGTISWYSTATGGTALGTGTSFTTPTISTTTTYYVETTSGGCTSTPRQPVVATVNSAPTITTGTTTNPTTCSGTDGSIVVNGTGTGTVSWTGTASGNATGVNLPYTITGLGAGSYAITFTNGCPSNTLNVSLSDPSAPTITGTTPGSRCGTGSVLLAATASEGTIHWYTVPFGGTPVGTGTTFLTPTLSTTTSFYAEADNGGCNSSRIEVEAIVHSIPVISQGTTLNPSTCIASNGSITINGSGTGTVSWSGASTGSLSNITLPSTITGLGAGLYTISLFTNNGCTSNSITSSLSDPPAPVIVLDILAHPTTCNGTDGTIYVDGTGVGDVSWTGTSSGSASGVNLPYIISGIGEGSYDVVFDNGCPSTSVNAILSDPPVPPAPVITVLNDCGSSILSTSGVNLVWSNGTVDTTSITVNNSGTYSVTQTVSGCISPPGSAVSAPLQIIVPTITMLGNDTICEGESVELVASESTDLIWSPTNETTPSITVQTGGSYSVSYTAANGCVGLSIPVNVVVNPLPVVTIDPFDTIWLCVNDQPIMLSGGWPTGGTYSGNAVVAGEFDPLIAGAGVHDITYIYVDGNGCQNSTIEPLIVDDCLNVPDSEITSQFLIYPNPTTGFIQVNSDNEPIDEIRVYDAAGRIVQEMKVGKMQITLDLSRKSSGVYHLEIKSSVGTVVRSRITKK